QDYAEDYLGSAYAKIGIDYFSVDSFNPVTKTLTYRSSANTGAARVIPGVLALLMYYCAYSLSCDMFASERDRGFFTKLLMTPVKPSEIIKGKFMAIISIVTVASVVTFFFLFLSSWLNRSNDAMSLLPFGMLLTPTQLIYMLLVIPGTAFTMTALTFNITFALTKMDEIITNLQFPLVLFLFDFFISMFRWQRPVWLEYLIPMHNTIAVVRDIFMSQHSLPRILISILVNILAGTIIYRKTCKKEGFQ
ncbi:MAG: ABC transporter permease subunit, partial [Clostridiales bacterium]|nr:ABC transporter permease subunit [Clostridiales bacterium]